MKNLKQQRKLFDVMLKQYYKDLLTEILNEIKDTPDLTIHWDKIEQFTNIEWHNRLFRGLLTYKDANLALSIGLGGVRFVFHFPRIDTYYVQDDYQPQGPGLEWKVFKNPDKPATHMGWYYSNSVIDGDVSTFKTRMPATYKKFKNEYQKTVDALTFTKQLDMLPAIISDY